MTRACWTLKALFEQVERLQMSLDGCEAIGDDRFTSNNFQPLELKTA